MQTLLVALFLLQSVPQNAGAIAGRILNGDGSPAVRVRVSAFEVPNSKAMAAVNAIAVAITDAEGRYRLAPLAPGQYRVFPNALYSIEITESELQSTAPVTVRSRRDAAQDITLPAPARGVTVSGRVRGDVRAERIREIFLSTQTRFLRTKIGSDGTFSFQNVVSGDYGLSLPAPHFAWGNRSIHVGDQDVSDLEFELDEATVVGGRIVIEGGGPAPRFAFKLEGAKGATIDGFIWTTDSLRSSGMASQTGWADRPDDVLFGARLPVGEYRISLANLPADYAIKSFTSGSTDLLAEKINLSGVLPDLSIVLTRAKSAPLTRFSGKLVRDVSLVPHLPADRVTLHGNGLLAPLEGRIARDGSFEISNVPPGVYEIGGPVPRTRVTIGKDGVRGVEFRASLIQAQWNELMRRAAEPPQTTAPTAEEEPRSEPEEPPEESQDRSRAGVSGRVTGIQGGFTENVAVTLSGESFHNTNTDSQGRFEFTGIPAGYYRLATSGPTEQAVLVRETDIKNIELRVPPPKKIVRGRFMVEGGYALPLVALTIRPSLDAGPPFVQPYTLWSAANASNRLGLDSDGRFRLELPEGRHRLRADTSEGYLVKSIRYGSTDLMREPLKLDSTPDEVVVTLTTLPAVAWTKVAGAVSGRQNIKEPVSVRLSNDRTKHEVEIAPKADGKFEFPKVLPGIYSISLTPAVAAASTTPITVDGRKIAIVNLKIPAQRNVALQIESENGNLSTNLRLVLRLNRFEAYTMYLNAPMVLRSSSPSRCIEDSCSNPPEKTLGSPSFVSSSHTDGKYVLKLPEGEYSVELEGVPRTHELLSISYGNADLLQEPLRVDGDETKSIVVKLRRP
jgi:hypothetical protein